MLVMSKYYYPIVHYWTLWFSEAMIYYLKKNGYRINQRDSIMDIGCGIGYHCFQVLKYKPQNVTGIDISSETINFLKAFTDKIKFEAKDISNGDISAYKEQYSMVFSSDVYEHVSNPLIMLDNINTILKPGGIACITFPNWDHHGQNQFQDINTLIRQIQNAGFKEFKISVIQDKSFIHNVFMKLYLTTF